MADEPHRDKDPDNPDQDNGTDSPHEPAPCSDDTADPDGETPDSVTPTGIPAPPSDTGTGNGKSYVEDMIRLSLDATFDDLATAAGSSSFEIELVWAAKRSAEQYLDSLPLLLVSYPLPYLERFHTDFLVCYAKLVLAASHVENLMADLCEAHFGKAEYGNTTHHAHEAFGRMRGHLEAKAPCKACRKIAAETKMAIRFRNMLVHGDWVIGANIASDEHKSLQTWNRKIARIAQVTKRKNLSKNKFQKLAKKAENDASQSAEFVETQVVSMGIVAAFTDTFTGLARRCEEELLLHGDQQGEE
mgnify:CR=1 FL=1